jgi:hypothetical protein
MKHSLKYGHLSCTTTLVPTYTVLKSRLVIKKNSLAKQLNVKIQTQNIENMKLHKICKWKNCEFFFKLQNKKHDVLNDFREAS